MEDLLKRRYTGGRGLPTTKLLGRMIGQARRPRYVVIVFLYCCTPLSCPLSRHAHLRCNLHYFLPSYSRVTILLCTTLLSCWHDFTVTIVIRRNHQRDPTSRISTLFSLLGVLSILHNNIPKLSHKQATGWLIPQTHAEHQPRHTQTFGILHRHVIFREPTATPESCAAIRLRWQP